MIVRERYKLKEFVTKHVDATKAIERWLSIVSKSQWRNHNELKLDYPSADYVGNNRYVFNIKGNNYRLIVVAVFFAGELTVRFIGTHAEYDKIDASTI